MTRHERIRMYQKHPAALAEEVARVLRPLLDDEDRIKHNCALSHFIVLFGNEEVETRMWANVARALIDTAIHEGVPNDGKAD